MSAATATASQPLPLEGKTRERRNTAYMDIDMNNLCESFSSFGVNSKPAFAVEHHQPSNASSNIHAGSSSIKKEISILAGGASASKLGSGNLANFDLSDAGIHATSPFNFAIDGFGGLSLASYNSFTLGLALNSGHTMGSPGLSASKGGIFHFSRDIHDHEMKEGSFIPSIETNNIGGNLLDNIGADIDAVTKAEKEEEETVSRNVMGRAHSFSILEDRDPDAGIIFDAPWFFMDVEDPDVIEERDQRRLEEEARELDSNMRLRTRSSAPKSSGSSTADPPIRRSKRNIHNSNSIVTKSKLLKTATSRKSQANNIGQSNSQPTSMTKVKKEKKDKSNKAEKAALSRAASTPVMKSDSSSVSSKTKNTSSSASSTVSSAVPNLNNNLAYNPEKATTIADVATDTEVVVDANGNVTRRKAKRFNSITPPITTINKDNRNDGTEKEGYIGVYSPEARIQLLCKYLTKRKNRVWTKKIRYSVRKDFADRRLRVKGRFIKKEDEASLQEALMLAW